MKHFLKLYFISISLLNFYACSKNTLPSAGNTLTDEANKVSVWLTTADKTFLLQKQASLLFTQSSASNNKPVINVNASQTYQTIDGFGYSLTGGSAYVITQLPTNKKQALLNELFANDSNGIHISYLRISIGASDLNANAFTYDDMPVGETDTALAHFSLEPDKATLIPLLQTILKLNPNIKIIATPWSAPVWMKNNGSFIGGSLQPKYYGVYAAYFVKYIQEMQRLGITIHAITPQNEPLHGGNHPSMIMTAGEQTSFIKNYLGPAFQEANLQTKIVIYDHNCDRPDYPLFILQDSAAAKYVDGTAFHLYAGEIDALSLVHNAFPDKNIYFTEQYTSSTSEFGNDLKWHVKNVIIGAMRNWSRNALEWNLASAPDFGPHTAGGCTTCKGAFTIGDSVVRNVSYYIIAHASKFIPPGSVRIESNLLPYLHNVAFKTADGQKVLIVENDGEANQSFYIHWEQKQVLATLPAGSVATYVWK